MSNERERAEKAEAFLEREGYRHCDIPACNCGGWHQHKSPGPVRSARSGEAQGQASESRSPDGDGHGGTVLTGPVSQLRDGSEPSDSHQETGVCVGLRDVIAVLKFQEEQLRSINSQIASAGAARSGEIGWQPIETVPDRRVLLVIQHNGVRYVSVAVPKDAPDASHWMPLPDPPVGEIAPRER